MRIKALTLATAFLSAGFSLSAQENETKETIKYSNVTEFGFAAASPQGVSLEATTVHGVSMNKKHHFGLGLGIGINFHKNTYYSSLPSYPSYWSTSTTSTLYMPIFLNYRLCFKPDKKKSPHINLSAGGLIPDEGTGIYSSITAGFKAGAFSFSSGLSFMVMHRKEEVIKYYEFTDSWGYTSVVEHSEREWKWSYPFGITLKVGFTF